MKNSKILLCTSAMMVVACFTCKTNAVPGKHLLETALETAHRTASVARRVTISSIPAGALRAYGSAVKPSLPTSLSSYDRYARLFATDAKPVLPAKEEKIDKPDEAIKKPRDPKSVFQKAYIPTGKPTIPLLKLGDPFQKLIQVIGEYCHKTVGGFDPKLGEIAKEAYDVLNFVGAREIAPNAFGIVPELLSDDVGGIMSRWESRLAELAKEGFITFSEGEIPCLTLTERGVVMLKEKSDHAEINKRIMEKEHDITIASNTVVALRNISTAMGRLYDLTSRDGRIARRWPCSSIEYLISTGKNRI